MTKKDYVAIAKTFKDNTVHTDFYHGNFLDSLYDYFEQDNPNFNKEKFLEVCGI